jgi:hypothetical protein
MTSQVWENRIFTNVYNAISDICENVVNTSNVTPSQFPTTDISLLLGEDANLDLENNDCGCNLSYEVQVYTDGTNKIKLNQEIMERVYRTFKKMGFHMIYVRTVRDENTPELFRRVARFRRFIGDGEEIELLQV